LAETLAAPFTARGDRVEAHADAPTALGARMQSLAERRDLDLIVLCGGDGTLSHGADALHDHPAALGFVPLGTMNLFARALGMPTDPAAAAKAIASGKAQRIDMGRIGNRHFLHHVSFGLHPKMIRHRQRMEHAGRLGKMSAGIRAFFQAIRRPPLLDVELLLDGQPHRSAASTIVVSNNPLGEGHLPFQDDLSGARLGVYISAARQRGALTKAGIDMLLGRLLDNPDITAMSASKVELRKGRRRRTRVRASIDGELVHLRLPFRIATVPGALRVMAPAPPAEQEREPPVRPEEA
jgi:diacylglycerol kinase family enzyme